MKRRKGFTLIELLIVMAIVVALAVAMTSAFNPTLSVNKAGDARKKKDLNRIKTAFEEYYNDNGHFPGRDLVEQMNLASNCGSLTLFDPWLVPWPCDLSGNPYYVAIEPDENGIRLDEPKWFKIFTDLKNRKDSDITSSWYDGEVFYLGNGHKSREEVNYCVSSTNVLCTNSTNLLPGCSLDICYIMIDGGCRGAGPPDFPDNTCTGDNCYSLYTPEGTCSVKCKVSCCGPDCEE